MKLLLATRNRDKVKEIAAVFGMLNLEIVTADAFPDMPDVEEDGETLEENAIKKARFCSQYSGLWSLADDTGLEVAALGGAPGVYSARFAGENATYDDNCRKMLDEMRDKSDRRARFRTVIALSDSEGEVATVDGVCDGSITAEKRGRDGFGYDPVFLPDGFGATFAELSLAEKNEISHRGRALKAAKEAWGELLLG